MTTQTTLKNNFELEFLHFLMQEMVNNVSVDDEEWGFDLSSSEFWEYGFDTKFFQDSSCEKPLISFNWLEECYLRVKNNEKQYVFHVFKEMEFVNMEGYFMKSANFELVK